MKWLLCVLLIAVANCEGASVSMSMFAGGDDSASVVVHNLSGDELREPAAAVDLNPDPNIVHVQLTAAPFAFEVGEQSISGYAYNGQVPGPTIYAKRGDRMVVDFVNELETATTVHWHGLHVPIEMDGVTWQRAPILPGGSFRYEFDLNQTGTYWYHPHFDTERTLDLGLYGVIVIDDPVEPVVTDDVLLVLDSWFENESKADVFEHSAVDGKIRQWTVNGLNQPTLTVAGGSVVRARMVNVSNGGFLHLRWPGMEIIATDQGLSSALERPGSVVLGPSDRIEALWRVGEDGFMVEAMPYTVLGGEAYGDSQMLMGVEVTAPRLQPDMPPFAFTHQLPTPDPSYWDALYVLQGNSARGHWLINGEAFPDVTIQEVSLGNEAIIEVRNLSPAEHPYHLHGYGFEVLSVNGVPPPYRIVEDTINLKIYDTVRLRIVATNPGDWMTHCHILSHIGGGMMTVLRVR